jgi:hypothetical protein
MPHEAKATIPHEAYEAYGGRFRSRVPGAFRVSGGVNQTETSEMIADLAHSSHPEAWRMAAIHVSELI